MKGTTRIEADPFHFVLFWFDNDRPDGVQAFGSYEDCCRYRSVSSLARSFSKIEAGRRERDETMSRELSDSLLLSFRALISQGRVDLEAFEYHVALGFSSVFPKTLS